MLYKVVELADLFVDACLRNESGELMFLSVYGRDTAIQQFKASMQLKPNSGGISNFSLRNCNGSAETPHTVQVGNPDRFEVYSGRFPKDNLFGNLTHLWIYDPVLIKPNKATKIGWVMLNQPWDGAEVRDQLLSGVWGLYKNLSPVPLLDDWQSAIMHSNNEICVTWMTATNYPPLGKISAAKLVIDAEFTEIISSMVKSGLIGIDGQQFDASLVNQKSIVSDQLKSDSQYHSLQAKATLRPYLSVQQYLAMLENCKAEEGAFFEEKFKEMAYRVSTMPKTYDCEDENDPIVSLHYFLGDSDWYIIEKDIEDGVSQAFGYVILNGDLMCAELGYILISELVGITTNANGVIYNSSGNETTMQIPMYVELDLYFEPRPLSEVKQYVEQRYGRAVA